jgi:large subunit ribosomal protein L19
MRNLEAIVEKQYTKKGKGFKDISIGSAVKVNTKIIEGGKERIQVFEGILIAKKGSGLNEMLTIRKISYGGIGVERTFPIHSPMVESIKIVKPGEAKRAKLFYMRKAFGRKVRKEAMRFEGEMLAPGEGTIAVSEQKIEITGAVPPEKQAAKEAKAEKKAQEQPKK